MSKRTGRGQTRRRPKQMPAGRVLRVSDVLNTAFGVRAPDAPGTCPVAVVTDDGHVLNRAEMAEVIKNLATIAYDTFQLLDEEGKAAHAAFWQQVASEVQFQNIVTTMAAEG